MGKCLSWLWKVRVPTKPPFERKLLRGVAKPLKSPNAGDRFDMLSCFPEEHIHGEFI